MALVNHITEVITKATKATQKSFANPLTQLYILEWVEIQDFKGNKYKLKVILRKKGNGNVHFWSIMQKKNGKRKTQTDQDLS